ncbi:MAG: hypothetical protein EOO65_03775 [Methanosarcinales archaeon]|nr:MAG: hypothetical protein EOO65_03775 [Methanosarcinales archaeon]
MGECRHTTLQVARPQCVHNEKFSQEVRVPMVPGVAFSPFPVTSPLPPAAMLTSVPAAAQKHRPQVPAAQNEEQEESKSITMLLHVFKAPSGQWD